MRGLLGPGSRWLTSRPSAGTRPGAAGELVTRSYSAIRICAVCCGMSKSQHFRSLSALALYFTRHHEASLAAVQAAFPHVIRLSSKQVENTQAELWAMYYDLAFAAPGEGLLARLAPTDLDIGTIGLNLAANTVDIHALNYETLARRDVAPP